VPEARLTIPRAIFSSHPIQNLRKVAAERNTSLGRMLVRAAVPVVLSGGLGAAYWNLTGHPEGLDAAVNILIGLGLGEGLVRVGRSFTVKGLHRELEAQRNNYTELTNELIKAQRETRDTNLQVLVQPEVVLNRIKDKIGLLEEKLAQSEEKSKLIRKLIDEEVDKARRVSVEKKFTPELELFKERENAIKEELKDLQVVQERIKTKELVGLPNLNKAYYVYCRDLGKGGMGKTQLYYYAPTGEWVAVKTILPEHLGNIEYVDRFRREAMIGKELDHPNIAKVYGYGGDEFVAEEFKDNNFSLEALCQAIGADGFGIEFRTPDNTIERLNEILNLSNFYDLWLEKRKGIKPSAECLKLIERTKDDRRQPFSQLSEMQRSNIHRLNRLLLEKSYEKLCPRSNLYFISEFIRGKTLDEVLYTSKPDPDDPDNSRIILERRKLHPLKATRITVAVTDALYHVSQKGLVHRDLKPENVMLTVEGVVKLIDFGIARWGTVADLTGTGVPIGTQIFMAPEQMRGEKELTDKVDIYALGELYFEMLTGTQMFSAAKDIADLYTIYKFNNDYVPSVIESTEEIPPLSREILIRMMMVNKEDRPDHAEIFEAFEELLASLEGGRIRR